MPQHPALSSPLLPWYYAANKCLRALVREESRQTRVDARPGRRVAVKAFKGRSFAGPACLPHGAQHHPTHDVVPEKRARAAGVPKAAGRAVPGRTGSRTRHDGTAPRNEDPAPRSTTHAAPSVKHGGKGDNEGHQIQLFQLKPRARSGREGGPATGLCVGGNRDVGARGMGRSVAWRRVL